MDMNLANWNEDKKWSDRFLPEIKQILGSYLIVEPPFEEDSERNTDLIILKMDSVRIGCRVRRNYSMEKYSEQFTIRTKRPSGQKTELAKIIEGWGNYLFYGFADKEEEKLVKWCIVDLNKFRLWFNCFIVENKGLLPGIEKINKDKSSEFRAFIIKEMPSKIIFAKGEI